MRGKYQMKKDEDREIQNLVVPLNHLLMGQEIEIVLQILQYPYTNNVFGY
eukprot:UN07349